MPKCTALPLLLLVVLSVTTTAQDTVRIDNLLRLAAYQIRKPGEFKTDLDSAADFLARARTLNATVNDPRCVGLIALADSWLHEEDGHRDLAKKDAEDAIHLLTAYGKDYSALGEAWFQHSRFYPMAPGDGCANIEADVTKAADAFHQAGNLEREAYTRQFLGDVLNSDYKYPESHKALQQALLLYQQVPGAQLEGLYDLLGYNSALRGDYTQATKYGLLACKTAEAHQDSSDLIATIYGRLAYSYLQQHEYDNAVLTAKKGLRAAERLGKIDAIYVIGGVAAAALAFEDLPLQALQLLKALSAQHPIPDTNALNLFLWNGYLRAYIKLRPIDQGQQMVDKILALLRRDRASGGELATYYIPVIEFFLRAGKLDSAKKYIAAQYVELQHTANSQFFRSINAMEQYRLDTAEHRYKAASIHVLKYKLINDSILDEKKITEIADLEMEYETEKKESELKLKDLAIQMLTQKDQLQRANLRRAEFTRNVTIAAGCLLALILAALYRQYRHKQITHRVISNQNRCMQTLLADKESLLRDNQVLVRELHHRIKNNLQMITSLLESQTLNLKAEALLAVQKSQHRVQAIALIHQKLYLRDDATAVSMSIYLNDITTYLQESFLSDGNIIFSLDIDPIDLDADRAIPIGLIVNETITNSIKYAFPDNRRGLIGITMKSISPDWIVLIISDNGIGLSQQPAEDQSDSLGFNLIRGLSKSLRGALTIHSEAGTIVELIFPLSSKAI
jgi:two-component sensor histidine kinase